MMISNVSKHTFYTFIHKSLSQPMISQILSHFCQQYFLNKTVLLFHIWFALNQQGRLKKSQIEKLNEAIYYWHEHIHKPIFALYEMLKSAEDKKSLVLKQSISEDLARVEAIEQRLLVEALYFKKKYRRNPRQQLADACYNLANYFKYQKTNVLAKDRHILGIILQAVFTELISADIHVALEYALSTHASKQSGCTQLSMPFTPSAFA